MQITHQSVDTKNCHYCGEGLSSPYRRKTAVCRHCRQIAVIRMFVEIHGEIQGTESRKDSNSRDLRQVSG